MIKKYLSLVKFSHTIFAMPFALIGFFLAIKTTDFNHAERGLELLLLVVLSMIFARNAAMSFNRFLDRKIDKKNPRTSVREIPAGIIKPTSAMWFVILNSLFFISTTYFINSLVFYLSPIALLVVLGYSYTKRFTWLCHFVLGLGLSLAPIGAYLAVTGKFDLLPVLFSLTVLFWTAGFDIIYALQDEEFDKKENLKSIPVLLGKRNALILSSALHVISTIFVIWAGLISIDYMGIWYWGGALSFAASLLYQHLIIKEDDLSRVNLAFFTTNGIASFAFAAFTVTGLYT
ncbi:MAG: UbiA family prenyltransferase [bacterium]|nr:UbiA family prenyltransferase [bacterium]